MELYSKVIKEVEASESGSHIGAFFDFDGTVIYGYSATTYLREQVKRGDISPAQLIELVKVMSQFSLGSMDFSVMLTMASQFLEGVSEENYLDFSEQLFKKHIAKLIYPESRALIEAHLKKGHTVALVSAATPYQIMPAARELGIKHVKCSQLEVVDGKFTGSVVRPTCYGMGKVDAADQLIEEFGLKRKKSFFYSDSDEDLQLLEYVGKPRPLNPNDRLRRLARGRGWPVQDFNSRGRASLKDYFRTAATHASLLTSFLAGLPIYALTGSVSKTRNFSTSLFADTALALTGVELEVEGEEHLWSSRPCVFVFNHQSQADVMILAALLRRDLAGIGKKEIGDVPILGKVMQFAGTVLIDRDNTESAKKAMKPLIKAMRDEGRSVCIAPEGTRSLGTNIGRFKKGAFHLAKQAKAPIVPIVIHNAIDVAPRGQFVFKAATVKVTVLPPVDTKKWKKKRMDEHVHDVRDLFLEELDQMRFQPSREERMKLERDAKILEAKKRKRDKQAKASRAESSNENKTAPSIKGSDAGVKSAKKVKSAKRIKSSKIAKSSKRTRAVSKQPKAKASGSQEEKKEQVINLFEQRDANAKPKRRTRRSTNVSAPKVSARNLKNDK